MNNDYYLSILNIIFQINILTNLESTHSIEKFFYCIIFLLIVFLIIFHDKTIDTHYFSIPLTGLYDLNEQNGLRGYMQLILLN